MEVIGASTAELEKLAVELGEPAYRGRQLAEWVYKKNVDSFASMTSLPAAFRGKLQSAALLYRSEVIRRSKSRDGTTKFLLKLSDGQCIESVLLPYKDRVTVCVSSQVGCTAGCVFCATAVGGFIRNLTAGEIVDQVLTLEREAGKRVTNVVYMGRGEPLFNYDEVLKSVRILNKEVGIAMRKITISTVGIVPRIQKLKSENLQLTLAISLHAPNDALRHKIIPLASRYPLSELLPACKEYAEATGRRVTFEYLLLAEVNDTPAHAEKLAVLLKDSLSNVNLIPYNEVAGKGYKRPSATVVNAFRKVLEDNGIEVTQRYERGHSIAAACGQLRANSL